MMKTVIVGCGNIGVKRLNAIENIPEIDIVGLVEIEKSQIQDIHTYVIKIWRDKQDKRIGRIKKSLKDN